MRISSEEGTYQESIATSATKPVRVGFAQCNADESDWRKANTKSEQQALSTANRFDLILNDSKNDAAKQAAVWMATRVPGGK